MVEKKMLPNLGGKQIISAKKMVRRTIAPWHAEDKWFSLVEKVNKKIATGGVKNLVDSS